MNPENMKDVCGIYTLFDSLPSMRIWVPEHLNLGLIGASEEIISFGEFSAELISLGFKPRGTLNQAKTAVWVNWHQNTVEHWVFVPPSDCFMCTFPSIFRLLFLIYSKHMSSCDAFVPFFLCFLICDTMLLSKAGYFTEENICCVCWDGTLFSNLEPIFLSH